MYLIACGILLAIGAALNLPDRRGLLLSLLVGLNVFAPMPMWSAEAFYIGCVVAELVVLIGAVKLKCRASGLVFYASVALVISHFMGYAHDAGSNPLSPYRGIVKLLEVSQLLACMAFSPALARILRNRETAP